MIPVHFQRFGNQVEGPPAVNTHGMISSLADPLVEAVEKARDRREREQAADLMMQALGGQQQQPSMASRLMEAGGVAQPQTAFKPQSIGPGMADPSGMSGDYLATLRRKESGGNDYAKAPTSSATGRYQFTEGTWLDLMRSRPDLGLTPDGRLDPAQQERAIRAFTEQNTKQLTGAGFEATPGNLYMAHFLGSGGATRFLNGMRNNPDAPGASYVSGDAVAANRSIFFDGDRPRSAREVYAKLTSGFGGEQTAQADAPASGARPAQYQIPGQVGLPAAASGGEMRLNPALVRAMLVNPHARGFAERMLTQQMTPQSQYSLQVVGDQAVRFNNRTGATEVVRGLSKPNVEVKELNGRLLIVDKTSQTAADITPEGAVGGYRPMTDQERQAFGIPGETGGYIGPDGKPGALPGTTRIQNNIDQKGEGAFAKKAGEKQAERYSGLVDAADAAQSQLGDLENMRQLSRAIGLQGGTANLKLALAPFAESLGVNIEGIDDLQAFSSVLSKLAPTMRPAGSGATSDFEFKQFLNALPQAAQNPAAREMIIDTLESMARYKLEQGRVAASVLDGTLDRGEGEKQLRALGSPMQVFRQFQKDNPDLFREMMKQGRPKQGQGGPAAPALSVGGSTTVNGVTIKRVN